MAMRRFKTISKWVLGGLFIFAGANHFRDEAFYLKLMPDYIPAELHGPAVFVSGVCEVLLGVLLFVGHLTRRVAWGLVALLIAVFPANFYAFQHSEEIFGISKAVHFWRLPFQLVLIAWAWWYTRPDPPHKPTTTDDPISVIDLHGP